MAVKERARTRGSEPGLREAATPENLADLLESLGEFPPRLREGRRPSKAMLDDVRKRCRRASGMVRRLQGLDA